MTLKIENGDYVKNGTKLLETDCIDELLQNAVIALYAPRGDFYPDKDYGSYLLDLKTADGERAACLARQAVSRLDGIFIKSASETQNGPEFIITVNGSERRVLIDHERYI